MKCTNCESCDFESKDDTVEYVCICCGLLLRMDEEPVIEFTKTNEYQRCSSYELITCSTRRQYLEMLEKEWPLSHFENVKNIITEKLENRKINDSFSDNELILGITLKYATKNKIHFEYCRYQKILNVSTKKLGKVLRYIQAGIVSEGLCNEKVCTYISNHGDTGIVRPISLTGEKHPTSKSVCDRMTNQACKITNHNTEGEELLVTMTQNSLQNTELFEKYKFIIKNVYNYLKTTQLKLEGETITATLSLYVVGKRHGVFKSATEFCMRTRLTSVPTLKKMEKKYAKPEFIAHFF